MTRFDLCLSLFLAGVLAAGVLAACAPTSAPPAPGSQVAPQDAAFRRYAGTWVGPARYGPAANAAPPHAHVVTMRIREDGTFRYTFDDPPHRTIERLRGGGHAGTLRTRDGQVLYEFIYEEGTVTLVESGGQRMLILTGLGKGGHVDGARAVIELRFQP